MGPAEAVTSDVLGAKDALSICMYPSMFGFA